jgi:phosphoribosylformylglycinamidine cyclo-ligase
MMAKRYADAGVDIDAGDGFAAFIRSIDSPAVTGSLPFLSGGFAGGFEVDTTAFRRPVVLTTTDGVGTKLIVARNLGKYDTVGIDLVAMCVNDLVVHGARPVQFLDYIACASIDRSVLDQVIHGIVRGCEIAGCSLSGGETAELPGLYEPGAIDLAGFAVGIAERDAMLPREGADFRNALVYGLPSSGIHSNGLSLARSVIPPEDTSNYRELLTPTRIYVDEVLSLCDARLICAAAHITGGGLSGNLGRVIPKGTQLSLDWSWEEPAIFAAIRRAGDIEVREMRRVFNLGIGMALVVERERRTDFEALCRERAIAAVPIGTVTGG